MRTLIFAAALSFSMNSLAVAASNKAGLEHSSNRPEKKKKKNNEARPLQGTGRQKAVAKLLRP